MLPTKFFRLTNGVWVDETQELLQKWDARARRLQPRPLGVGDNPPLSDEYDAYIAGILRLLDTHCTVDQLERYLLDIDGN
jgi:hypothetical protein